jgi:nitric oxide synthase-interacting protein
MCTICNNYLIEPTSCDEGHLFCRSCVIEYLVKQKKRITDNQIELKKREERKNHEKQEIELENKVKKLEQFEKYDGFVQITERDQLKNGEVKN